MNHAHGHVDFKDGKRLYYEYNGTADRVCPKLWNTPEEVNEHWREEEALDRKCVCGKPSEVVCAFTYYGGGLWFRAEACRNCMVITNNPDPFENRIVWL
jgi:hypothetical protein